MVLFCAIKPIKVAGLLDGEAFTRMLPVSMGTDDGVSAGIHQNVQNKLHNIHFASIKFVFASFLSVQ